MQGWKWYELCWDGLINPMVFILPILAMGLMWEFRILSNRTYVLLGSLLGLAMVLHMDYVFFISGLTSNPIPPGAGGGWAPWPIRMLVYAAAQGFLTWGAWGWVRTVDGADKLALSRGLPYLKERWRERKEKRG